MTCYYRIVADDLNYPDRWLIDEPRTSSGDLIDSWHFTTGNRYAGEPPISMAIAEQGKPVRIHLAALDLPIVERGIGIAIGDRMQRPRSWRYWRRAH